MEKKDEIFDKVASGIMILWDWDKFKKSHPSLYEAIICSMELYANSKDKIKVAEEQNLRHKINMILGQGITDVERITLLVKLMLETK